VDGLHLARLGADDVDVRTGVLQRLLRFRELHLFGSARCEDDCDVRVVESV
jgi:hypothetical protein